MQQSDLEQLLKQFDPRLPVAEAHTAPAGWYVSSEFQSQESQIVLKNSWQLAGPKDWFQEMGSYLAGEFLGEPYMIVKDEQGSLKAFYNVCRHHAACLVHGRGRVKKIPCSYHGWTYGLNGQLLHAPGMEKAANFKPSEISLKPIALETIGPFVFINFAAKPKPIAESWKGLFEKLQASGYDKLKFVARREYEIKCNWKVYVDNYLDGGYHVKTLHKNLASQLDLQGYKIENFSDWTLQSCGSDGSSQRLGEGALYAWMYPNMMINRYGDIMDTNWVIPLGPDRCLTVFDYYFLNEGDKEFIEKSLAASDRVQREDIHISESVQKGLSSSAYGAGRYAPDLESGMHLFHSWLHRDLSVDLSAVLSHKTGV